MQLCYPFFHLSLPDEEPTLYYPSPGVWVGKSLLLTERHEALDALLDGWQLTTLLRDANRTI
jgi:hypothetical protein